MDIYLGRCLKNWAARHSPPADGRNKLLKRAAFPAEAKEAVLDRPYICLLKGHQASLTHQEDWLFGTFNQARLWSFDIATTMRLLA